jgi:hypothetical protein
VWRGITGITKSFENIVYIASAQMVHGGSCRRGYMALPRVELSHDPLYYIQKISVASVWVSAGAQITVQGKLESLFEKFTLVGKLDSTKTKVVSVLNRVCFAL